MKFFPGFRAAFLCLSCAFFALAAESGKSVTSRILLKSDTTAAGQPVRYPAAKNPEVTALEIEIPPGGETGWHTHTAPGYAYVLSGELTVETGDGRILVFKTGQPILESVGLLHNGRNLGSVPVKLAAFFTGEKGQAFTVKAKKP